MQLSNRKVGAAATPKGVIQVDENMFRMMATLNGPKNEGTLGHSLVSNKSGSSDDMVMGLLSKMSEAYMNSKKENGELLAKITDLENQNEDLGKKVNKQQKKIEKLKRKLQKHKLQGKDSEFEISENEENKGTNIDKNNSKQKQRQSNSNDHIPDILLGDVLKIKREDTLSPPTSRSSSHTRNSASAVATARVVQPIDSFKAPKHRSSDRVASPFDEKREISIRGASPLRQPPERLTTQDAEIVRSVRTRMMEKEVQQKKGYSEERNFENEYGTVRDKNKERGMLGSIDLDADKRQEREHEPNSGRYTEMDYEGKGRPRDDDRYQGRVRKYSRGSDMENQRQTDRNVNEPLGRRERENDTKRERSKSKDLDRRQERSRSREWGRGRKRSHSKSRDVSRSKERRTRSKSKGRSKSPDNKEARRSKSRSRSRERYNKRYSDRREEQSRFGYDNRRGNRERENDRFDRREREKERDREREKDYDQDRNRYRKENREMEDKEKERARLVKDKNDKIDIDEWTTKPTGSKNPALISIKEKLRQRDEEEEADKKRKQHLIEEDEKKQKWSNISAFEQQKPDPPKPQGNTRPQVAIQWGQRDKVTPDPQMSGMHTSAMKKTMPMVGKMPWLQRSNKSEERQNIYANQTLANPPDSITATAASKKSSRFGPPSAVSASLPPPMVLSDVPPPSFNQLSTSGVAPVPPPTVSQNKQSFNDLDKSSSIGTFAETLSISAPNSSNSEDSSSGMLRQPVPSRNLMPSQVDINSMLEAAKQHINRAKESKKVTGF